VPRGSRASVRSRPARLQLWRVGPFRSSITGHGWTVIVLFLLGHGWTVIVLFLLGPVLP